MGKGPAEKRGKRVPPEEVGYVRLIPGGKGRGRMVKKSPQWWEAYKRAGGSK